MDSVLKELNTEHVGGVWQAVSAWPCCVVAMRASAPSARMLCEEEVWVACPVVLGCGPSVLLSPSTACPAVTNAPVVFGGCSM